MNSDDLLTPVRIEPAESSYAVSSADEPPAPIRRCAVATLAGSIVFVLGLLGGGIAAKAHTEQRHAADMSTPSMAYLSAISAHVNENADYCTNLSARAHGAASRVRLPGQLFTPEVDAMIINALALPTGTVAHVTNAAPAATLAAGLTVNDIMLTKPAAGADAVVQFSLNPPPAHASRIAVSIACNACTQTADGTALNEAPHPAVPNINRTCASYLVLLARDAVGCNCCSLFSGSSVSDCPDAHIDVTGAAGVCAHVPLTSAQAADAENDRNDRILARADGYELGDIEQLAAAAFPSQLALSDDWLTDASVAAAVSAVQHVLDAAGKSHSQFLSTVVHAEWSPDGLPDAYPYFAAGGSHSAPKTLEDFIVRLTAAHAESVLRADSTAGAWHVDALTAAVTYDEAENAMLVSPTIVAALTLLRPFGAGLAVGAAARAVAPLIAYPAEVHSCDGGHRDDVVPQLINGAYAGLKRTFSSTLPFNNMQIGSVAWNAPKLFFLAAASAADTAPAGKTFNRAIGCTTQEHAGCEF